MMKFFPRMLFLALLWLSGTALAVETTYRVDAEIELSPDEVQKVKVHYQMRYPSLHGKFCYVSGTCEDILPSISRRIFGNDMPELYCDMGPCSSGRWGFEAGGEVGGGGSIPMPSGGPLTPAASASDTLKLTESVMSSVKAMSQMGFSAEGSFTEDFDKDTGKLTHRHMSFKITGSIGKGGAASSAGPQ